MFHYIDGKELPSLQVSGRENRSRGSPGLPTEHWKCDGLLSLPICAMMNSVPNFPGQHQFRLQHRKDIRNMCCYSWARRRMRGPEGDSIWIYRGEPRYLGVRQHSWIEAGTSADGCIRCPLGRAQLWVQSSWLAPRRKRYLHQGCSLNVSNGLRDVWPDPVWNQSAKCWIAAKSCESFKQLSNNRENSFGNIAQFLAQRCWSISLFLNLRSSVDPCHPWLFFMKFLMNSRRDMWMNCARKETISGALQPLAGSYRC